MPFFQKIIENFRLQNEITVVVDENKGVCFKGAIVEPESGVPDKNGEFPLAVRDERLS